ncbi:hypothetical protein BKA93DRAFT_454516 [Sparassis latifolia]
MRRVHGHQSLAIFPGGVVAGAVARSTALSPYTVFRATYLVRASPGARPSRAYHQDPVLLVLVSVVLRLSIFQDRGPAVSVTRSPGRMRRVQGYLSCTIIPGGVAGAAVRSTAPSPYAVFCATYLVLARSSARLSCVYHHKTALLVMASVGLRLPNFQARGPAASVTQPPERMRLEHGQPSCMVIPGGFVSGAAARSAALSPSTIFRATYLVRASPGARPSCAYHHDPVLLILVSVVLRLPNFHDRGPAASVTRPRGRMRRVHGHLSCTIVPGGFVAAAAARSAAPSRYAIFVQRTSFRRVQVPAYSVSITIRPCCSS